MDIQRLNINFGGRPSSGYDGDDSVFEHVARQVGHALPASYIGFIKTVDGGHPEIGSFAAPGKEEILGDIGIFYSFGGPQRGKNIRDVLSDWGEMLGESALPIGQDAGGNQVYIDLSEGHGSVWFYLHDEDDARVKLADSFEAFIAGLRANPDFI